MRHDALARLRRELEDKIAATEKAILDGLASDWANYRHAVSRRAALLEVRALMEDALDRD